MKYTKQKVISDLKAELKALSTKEWTECGDVNLEEHGGVRYKKDENGNIEAILYRGLSDLPDGIENEKHGWFSLEELTDDIDDIWDFSDIENCGLSIGWLIQSLDQYRGIFT